MTRFVDYYSILGTRFDASDAEIKEARQELAKRYHPDNQVTGDEQKFREIQEAYEVLSNPTQRKLYDSRYDSLEPLVDALRDLNGSFQRAGDNTRETLKRWNKE
ncbi:DnaJ domain-containing protein [Candidatus Woesearchaeota archaeon]|nr:DnaJ domain-containing protein [Candidatus Woesearchaeota archaeon]